MLSRQNYSELTITVPIGWRVTPLVWDLNYRTRNRLARLHEAAAGEYLRVTLVVGDLCSCQA